MSALVIGGAVGVALLWLDGGSWTHGAAGWLGTMGGWVLRGWLGDER